MFAKEAGTHASERQNMKNISYFHFYRRSILSVTFLCLLLLPAAKGQTSYAITDIGSILASYGFNESYASSINNRGEVVGGAVDFGFAYFYSDGRVLVLGTLGGLGSETLGINNRGQIVGEATMPGPGDLAAGAERNLDARRIARAAFRIAV